MHKTQYNMWNAMQQQQQQLDLTLQSCNVSSQTLEFKEFFLKVWVKGAHKKKK
jgi:hypothetical protein